MKTETPMPMKLAPRAFTARELESVGVKIVDPAAARLECAKCEQVWSPNLRDGGKLPRGYWRCPNGCNGNG